MCTAGGNVKWYYYKNSMEVPQKIKNKKTNYYIIQKSHFQVYSQRKWNHYLEEIICILISIATVIYDSQEMEITEGFKEAWIKKIWHMHLLECYLAIKKRKNLPFIQHRLTVTALYYSFLAILVNICDQKSGHVSILGYNYFYAQFQN